MTKILNTPVVGGTYSIDGALTERFRLADLVEYYRVTRVSPTGAVATLHTADGAHVLARRLKDGAYRLVSGQRVTFNDSPEEHEARTEAERRALEIEWEGLVDKAFGDFGAHGTRETRTCVDSARDNADLTLQDEGILPEHYNYTTARWYEVAISSYWSLMDDGMYAYQNDEV